MTEAQVSKLTCSILFKYIHIRLYNLQVIILIINCYVTNYPQI